MATFICEKCGCIDNSACGGNYWLVTCKFNSFAEEYANSMLLCAECTPNTFEDGSKKDDAGKWHNTFPKRHWSELGDKEFILHKSEPNMGTLVNAKEYFEKYHKDSDLEEEK